MRNWTRTQTPTQTPSLSLSLSLSLSPSLSFHHQTAQDARINKYEQVSVTDAVFVRTAGGSLAAGRVDAHVSFKSACGSQVCASLVKELHFKTDEGRRSVWAETDCWRWVHSVDIVCGATWTPPQREGATIRILRPGIVDPKGLTFGWH